MRFFDQTLFAKWFCYFTFRPFLCLFSAFACCLCFQYSPQMFVTIFTIIITLSKCLQYKQIACNGQNWVLQWSVFFSFFFINAFQAGLKYSQWKAAAEIHPGPRLNPVLCGPVMTRGVLASVATDPSSLLSAHCLTPCLIWIYWLGHL